MNKMMQKGQLTKRQIKELETKYSTEHGEVPLVEYVQFLMDRAYQQGETSILLPQNLEKQ